MELQSFIDEQRRLFFESRPGDSMSSLSVCLAKWAREHYYYCIRMYLIDKSWHKRKFSHKVVAGRFVPVIPPSTLADEGQQKEATELVERMTDGCLEAFNDEL